MTQSRPDHGAVSFRTLLPVAITGIVLPMLAGTAHVMAYERDWGAATRVESAPIVENEYVDRGRAAMERGDEEAAFSEFRAAAEQGNSDAQSFLGFMYSEGRGVARDDIEAVHWFRAAAEQGDATAQYNLGLMYGRGLGVGRDDVEAVRWFRAAAEQGLAVAQRLLGISYVAGDGVASDDAEAARWLRAAAEQGDAVAQRLFGAMYAQGRTSVRDDAEAVRWLRAAAEHGDAYAQYFVGLIYANGRGVDRNDAEAVRWYRLAAQQGDPRAQNNLGFMYAEGLGVVMDEVEAVRWYLLAAEQGYAIAQFNVGYMHEQGRGVPKNDAEAVRWFRLAAEQGRVNAQRFLGLMYAEGRGIQKNFVQSYKWISLAAAQGDEMARSELSILERRMRRDQITEAQQLAAEFRPGTETTGVASAGARRPGSNFQIAPVATVRNIQRHLATLGYDPGPADGLIGPRTIRAIQAFQRDANIEPDGIATTTLESMLAAIVEETPEEAQSESQITLASTGTGFFVSNQGHVLTNHHVIDGCSELRVALSKGAADARQLAANQEDDLAILVTDTKVPAVVSFRRTPPALGEDVLVAGYPLRGLLAGINVTSGSISSTSGVRGDVRYVQLTAPIQPGNSGGPLLDRSGLVLGVVVASLDAIAVAEATGGIPQNVNFAVKGAVAQSFLSIHDIDYREAAPGREKRREAIAEEAQKHTVLVECWK